MDTSAHQHPSDFQSHDHPQPDYAVALDIGTTKVCAIVGRRNDLNQMEILGHARVAGDGVQRGVVNNIHKTVAAIEEAIRRAERASGLPIRAANIGIAGQHIASRQNNSMIARDDHTSEITQADLDELMLTMRKLPLKPGEEILHIIPQDYSVDDEWGILEPIGMCGGHLAANFHIITCQNAASRNIIRCARQAELEVAGLTLEPIASAASVLTEADKHDGVVLVDIGGGTTDITIFADGMITHTCVIPFGGDVITSDIRQVFRITLDDAENLKTRYGNALEAEAVPDRYYRMANRRGQDSTEIADADLAGVIEARVSEILKYVNYQITTSGARDRLQGGIVLTGGGSLLLNIDRLTELHTGIPCRIGLPVEHLAQGYPEELSSPIFATAIGLLIGGVDKAGGFAVHKYLRNGVSVGHVNAPAQASGFEPTHPSAAEATVGVAPAATATVTSTGDAAQPTATVAVAPVAVAAVAEGPADDLAPEGKLAEKVQRSVTTVLDRVKEWFDGVEDPDLD